MVVQTTRGAMAVSLAFWDHLTIAPRRTAIRQGHHAAMLLSSLAKRLEGATVILLASRGAVTRCQGSGASLPSQPKLTQQYPREVASFTDRPSPIARHLPQRRPVGAELLERFAGEVTVGYFCGARSLASRRRPKALESGRRVDGIAAHDHPDGTFYDDSVSKCVLQLIDNRALFLRHDCGVE
jgi:hypothetical protein